MKGAVDKIPHDHPNRAFHFFASKPPALPLKPKRGIIRASAIS
jgi:hypothetical protein